MLSIARHVGLKLRGSVAAYKQQNHDLFVTAERYQIEDLRDHGYTYDIDKFYKMMLPALEEYVVQDMKDIASSGPYLTEESERSF